MFSILRKWYCTMCCDLCACVHDVRMYACLCRSICKGVLEALAFCHQRGVAHGSLGPGSILLNTFRDKQSRDLIVKLDNLGFAQLHRTGVPSELISLLTPLIQHSHACTSGRSSSVVMLH